MTSSAAGPRWNFIPCYPRSQKSHGDVINFISASVRKVIIIISIIIALRWNKDLLGSSGGGGYWATRKLVIMICAKPSWSQKRLRSPSLLRRWEFLLVHVAKQRSFFCHRRNRIIGVMGKRSRRRRNSNSFISCLNSTLLRLSEANLFFCIRRNTPRLSKSPALM